MTKATGFVAALFIICSYLFGLSIGQLVLNLNYISKRYLFVSIVLYVLVTLLMSYSQSINAFIFLRFITGLIVAVILLAIKDIQFDLLQRSGNTYINMMSSYVIIFIPIIAPLIGSTLHSMYYWQAPIYFLVAYAIVIGVLALGNFQTDTQIPTNLNWQYYIQVAPLVNQNVFVIDLEEFYFNISKNTSYIMKLKKMIMFFILLHVVG